MTISREIHLIARPPDDLPVPGEVAMVEVPVPAPGPGQAVVRNMYMAIDPGLLQRMRDLSDLHVPHFQLGEPMWGHAIGEVVESAGPDLRVGDVVLHHMAWREYAVADAKEFTVLDTSRYPSISHHLSSAIVSYCGLRRIGIEKGDTVVVSSAAGAVGSVVGQLARIYGASRVVGSVGSAEKVRFVTEKLGFDEAFDYHDGWPEELGGVDVYYDNVGGWQLDSAVNAMRPHGRILLCGSSEEHSTGRPHGHRTMQMVIGKRLNLIGFTTNDHLDLLPEFEREFPPLVRDGRVVLHETFVDGLDELIPAIKSLLDGAYLGKVLLRF
ncbi:zinc-binding dehydrogenase [Plantactinospora sp. WMMC1484]|uniref:zinc-binding dehydrogenase n=1 Tax=Plantactinospora sp. WMMC1484 TaxID=3404122 RepID=UPI003BF4A308